MTSFRILSDFFKYCTLSVQKKRVLRASVTCGRGSVTCGGWATNFGGWIVRPF